MAVKKPAKKLEKKSQPEAAVVQPPPVVVEWLPPAPPPSRLEVEANLCRSQIQAMLNEMASPEPSKAAAFVLATQAVQTARVMQDMLREV